jgi:plasmid stabilization system protein ParE
MKSRYVLSPEAVEDLASIWHYIQTQSSVEMANRVESVIRERIAFWRVTPVRATNAGSDGPARAILPRVFVLDRLPTRNEAPADRLDSPRSAGC